MNYLPIAITALITALALAAQHYAFRREIRGKNLSRTQAYIMGSGTIGAALTGLYLYWGSYRELAAMLAVGGVSGMTVIVLRHLMVVGNLKRRANVAEAENEIHRNLDD